MCPILILILSYMFLYSVRVVHSLLSYCLYSLSLPVLSSCLHYHYYQHSCQPICLYLLHYCQCLHSSHPVSSSPGESPLQEHC
ncbi:hypothetical protein GBAR_LOCUS6078 [Geodia barretti]|uniref:Uncharacterized protein n=1 Tax=Geodia barretti TaxID=519541 RepID=A0AA35RD05_GEOBA|nr:hypothetical protein GBAR_LOCUS6078 [Geodia barretti]